MSIEKKGLSTDLKLVRSELKELLSDVKNRKTSLKRANTIIYACSNITRAVVAEMNLNRITNEVIDNEL